MQLRNVTTEIAEQFTRTGTWLLAVDDVRRLLELDYVRFYQDIYNAAHRPSGTVEVSTVTAEFGPENVGELVDLLELFAGNEAERRLGDVGAFIAHPDRVSLTQRLLETAADQARNHGIDRSSFRGMLRTLGSYERARDTYFAEFFSRDAIMEDAVGRFLDGRRFELPELAARTARSVAERLFRSRILEIQTLLVDVGLELFEIAVAEGYARRPEDEFGSGEFAWEDFQEEEFNEADAGRREQRTRGRDERAQHNARAWACGVLELNVDQPDAASIRRNYKRLMLRYHPDINPRGLRTAQRINRAYALLMQHNRS